MATSKFWASRIGTANQDYSAWAKKYDCDILERYYEGEQYRYNRSFGASRPYQVNLVYSTIKIKAANLLLAYPEYRIKPRPGNSDWNQEFAIFSAQLKEDVLNTVVSNDKEAFGEIMEMAFLDSMFRFGTVEVGYANDWLRNPLATIPLRDDQVTKINKEDPTLENKTPKIAGMPADLPQEEQVYFKHIPARRFRVGAKDNIIRLHRADWYGYYEWVALKDLKCIDGLKSDWLKAQPAGQTADTAGTVKSVRELDEEERRGNELVKVWHAWDPRAGKRYLILDSPCEVMWSENFKGEPVMELKWDISLRRWYPIPPVFQWISPQNEYNESREMMRNHRKRFVRKFQIEGDDLEQDEMDKFTSNEDGAIIKVPRKDAISPIQNPELSNMVGEGLVVSRSDFDEMSGTARADRGASDRTTATESQRIAQKSDVREAFEDSKIKKFMCRLGRAALDLIASRFETGTWAKLQSDPGEQLIQVMQQNPAYQWVSSEVLDDGYDFMIDADIVSASPSKLQEEQGQFITFLSLVAKFPQVALSPLLIRECAYRSGYRNEKVIKEMQTQAQLAMMGQLAQAQAQSGGGGAAPAQNQVAQQKVAQQTPPQAEQISNQIDQQLTQ